MKTLLIFIFSILFVVAGAQEPPYDFVIFNNSRMGGYYFFSKADAHGGSFIRNEKGKLPVSDSNYFTPGSSLLLEYTDAASGNWTASIQKPGIRGQDHFRSPKFLSFFIFCASTDVMQSLPFLQLLMNNNARSGKVSFKIKKANTWEHVLIPLSTFTRKDLSDPSGVRGLVFSQRSKDGKKHRILIDDIELLPSETGATIKTRPAISSTEGFSKHIDIQWDPITDPAVKYVKVYRSSDDTHDAPVGVQLPSISRYTDYTGETGNKYRYQISFVDRNYRESTLSDAVSAETRAMSDEELMTMVQEATFRYFWDGAEKNSGLAKENISGRQNMIAMGASGFGIMALIAGTERGFITRQQSVERFIRIVNFLEATETFHGAFSHFVDGHSKKVEPFFGNRDNGGDLVETSFLIQGLLAARAYFDKKSGDEQQIRDKITKIWQRVEWDWYKQRPDSKFLYWHWSPDQGWIINHTLIGWNETMVTYLLAISSPTHSVPASMYYSGWANQDSTGQRYRMNWGQTKEGSMYTNGNTYFGIKLDVGVSNGGPLFFTHFSYMGYDPHLLTDKYTNYFENNRNIALINHQYCVNNPGNYKGYSDSCWGLTANEGPYDYTADEPVLTRDHGKIGPSAALSSFPYTPVQSMKALRNYYNNYGKFLWGEYGFYDVFNLTENWVSDIYMGLSEATIVAMIENYRSGLIWKLFMSNPEIQKGLEKLALESPVK